MNPYDEKLKEAMAEIRAIIKKHDIGAQISLASKTHSEFEFMFPTWSIIQHHEDEDEDIRIKCKRKDYDSDEARDDAVDSSCHMILSLGDLGLQAYKNVNIIRNMMENNGVEISHEPLSNPFYGRDN